MLTDAEDVLRPHAHAYERRRQALVKKYAEEEGGKPKTTATPQGGQSIAIDEERREEFEEEIDKLQRKTVKVEGLQQIPYNKIAPALQTVGDLAALRLCVKPPEIDDVAASLNGAQTAEA